MSSDEIGRLLEFQNRKGPDHLFRLTLSEVLPEYEKKGTEHNKKTNE